jgi:hypothetical protein
MFGIHRGGVSRMRGPYLMVRGGDLRVIPSEEGTLHTVLRQPIGAVAAFSPWNFSMGSPARKVGGALSSGCSIILKASEETPAGAVQVVRAFHDAELPPGVLNLVFGNPAEISNYLIPKSSVRLITFTGSIPVGKSLAEVVGRHMEPAIVELGGHRLRRRRPSRNVRRWQVPQRRASLSFADAVLCSGIDLSAFRRFIRRKSHTAGSRRRT